MCNRTILPVRRVSRFRTDQDGSASTEWIVAVAVVVMMAVPVMALIGDGSEINSENVVISIQDADSFGGQGFHGNDGDQIAFDPDAPDDEDFNPGEDLGIGFPDPDKVTARNEDDEVDRPRFYTSAGGSGIRRDKPTLLEARPRGGNGVVQGSNANQPNIQLPSASNRRVVLGEHDCFVAGEEQTADASGIVPIEDNSIIASGR